MKNVINPMRRPLGGGSPHCSNHNINRRNKQKGVVLLEAVLSALLMVFAITGVLALISRATVTVDDSEFRTLATERASEILETIRLGVTRDASGMISEDKFNEYLHMSGGNECDKFSGTASSNKKIQNWVNRLSTGDNSGSVKDAKKIILPGLEKPKVRDKRLQIKYENKKDANDPNAKHDIHQITVTICWQAPNDTTVRKQQLSAYIN